nr:LON peptidase substrate-binding domain-containing protein [uncultured Roseateles sp.]
MSTPVLPLFPLQAVLFPGGQLRLKIFEARYLDLMADCLRQQSAFGVIALRQGSEVGRSERRVQFEPVGVAAELLEVDGEQAGILHVRCRGGLRFELQSSAQAADGLWMGQVQWLEEDAPQAIPPDLKPAAKGLAKAINSLAEQGSKPFLEPYGFDDAAWVANRWCEILPIPLAAKQKLMELDSPLMRLQIVDEFLRGKGVLE